MQTPTTLTSLLVASLLLSLVTGTPGGRLVQWALTREQPNHELSANRDWVIEQNETICDAGSKQWTGVVPLGGERDMFFWYFESRHNPDEAPLIIWLNGGPGASSLLGALYEIRPCRVTDDGTRTERSESSWTEFANVVFIDQPIGVGFSKPQNSSDWAQNLREGASDLDKFLDKFLHDYFPGLQNRPVHLAGESFGGKYCPVYADAMRRKFDSIILVNALVDFSDTISGLYEHFCAHKIVSLEPHMTSVLNSSTCEELGESLPECEKHGRLCETTYDLNACQTALEKCSISAEPYQRLVVPGGQNPYDDRQSCVEPPMCGRLGMQELSTYLNQDWVQHALGFEERHFEPVNLELNALWATQGDVSLPSTREIVRLLDERNIPILVLNGNSDVIVNTEGILRTYDNLLWSGHAEFQSNKLVDWYFTSADGKQELGGQAKSVKHLALVTIDNAGHMSPRDQPEAVSEVMQAWLDDERIFSKDFIR